MTGMMENPVFILGSHKSGTSLLRSLLDGAPELFVVPIEAHFFQHGGLWVDYALRRSLPSDLTFDELIERFTEYIRRTNEKSLEKGRTSDSVLPGRWDVNLFRAYLREVGAERFKEAGFRGFLDSYVEAIHASLYREPPRVSRFVEKSVENAEWAVLLKRLYPDAKFIHLLRNPYATLVSIRRHVGRKRYPFLGRILSALENSFYYLYRNPLLIAEYKIVRYEDLVTKPREVMQDIAGFIGIEFSESLLQPTVLGVPWGGNSTSGEQFEGISTRPLVHWRQEIQPLEIAFVNVLFEHVIRDYEYQSLPVKGSLYRPCPGERWKVYLANRVLWRLTIADRAGLAFM